MANLNECTFIGRLAADPEIRALESGKAVVNFRLAVNSYWRDRSTGEKRESTEYIPVEVWGAGAQHAQRLLMKGKEILVRGRLKTRKWLKDEETRYSTSVVCESFQLLGPRPTSAAAMMDSREISEEPVEELHATDGPYPDEEIPF